MIEFLKAWATEIIATLALIQPWVIAIWRRFFRPGSIEIHETSTIEVGYSSFGATIGLHGTLRALYQDMFVRSIELTVVKLKDSSQHLFEWGLFRTAKLTITGSQEGSLESPYGFMLTTAQPHRYNIQFFDVSMIDEVRPYIQRVREAWTRTLSDAGSEQLLEQDLDLPEVNRAIQQALGRLYSDFFKTNEHVDAYTALDRLCYWEPGRYSLEMRVKTTRPKMTFTRNWTFELSQTDSSNLHLNVLRVLQETCGRPFGQYFFAFAKYHVNG